MSKESSPQVIDCDSDEDFSDAIETPTPLKEAQNDDDFFDVPEWRESKEKEQENEDKEENNDSSPNEAEIEDMKAVKLKERTEREDKLSPNEKEELKIKALEMKKEGNELYLAGENGLAIEKYNQALGKVIYFRFA